MNRYIIQTLVTCKGKTFLSKESFKKWFVENLVPQDSDPLRKYNPEDYSEIDRNEYYKKLTSSGNEMELIPYLDDNELDNRVDFLKTLSFSSKNQKLSKSN